MGWWNCIALPNVLQSCHLYYYYCDNRYSILIISSTRKRKVGTTLIRAQGILYYQWKKAIKNPRRIKACTFTNHFNAGLLKVQLWQQ